MTRARNPYRRHRSYKSEPLALKIAKNKRAMQELEMQFGKKEPKQSKPEEEPK